MEKDWIFRTDEYICDLRTVGILVRDGKLLVQRDRDGSEYALPGGHVKIGETTADGLVREYKDTNRTQIADIFICPKQPVFLHHSITAQSP